MSAPAALALRGGDCAICYCSFQADGSRAPVVFSQCGHTICKSCNLRLEEPAPVPSGVGQLAAGKNQGWCIKCPSCHQVSPSPLVKNYEIINLIQANGTAFDSHQRSAFCENCPPGDVDVPSTIYCTNCLISLCDECDGTIHRSSAMQRHKRAFHQVGKLLNESYLNNGADPEPVKYQLCPNHNDLLKLYCFTCNELVCRECVSDMMPTYGSTTSNGNFRGGNHWQHCVQFMSQVARHRRALLSDHIEQLESISRIMQAKLSHSCRVSPQNSFITHEHSLQQCARNFSTPLAVDIRRGSFGELSQCVDKWFSSAMDSLLSQKERCLAQLQQSHKLSLRTSAMALEEFQRLNVDNIETTLSQLLNYATGDDASACLNYTHVKTLYEEAIGTPVPSAIDNNTSFISLQLPSESSFDTLLAEACCLVDVMMPHSLHASVVWDETEKVAVKLTWSHMRKHQFVRTVPDNSPQGEHKENYIDPAGISINVDSLTGSQIPQQYTTGDSTPSNVASKCDSKKEQQSNEWIYYVEQLATTPAGRQDDLCDTILEVKDIDTIISVVEKVATKGEAEGSGWYETQHEQRLGVRCCNAMVHFRVRAVNIITGVSSQWTASVTVKIPGGSIFTADLPESIGGDPPPHEATLQDTSTGVFERGGIIHWIGTRAYTMPWQNPHVNGEVKVAFSSELPSPSLLSQPHKVVDLVPVGYTCTGISLPYTGTSTYTDGEWISLDLGRGRALECLGFALRSSEVNSVVDFVFQACNDKGGMERNWTTLYVAVEENSSNVEQHISTCSSVPYSVSYHKLERSFTDAHSSGDIETFRYFRIKQTRKNKDGSGNLFCSGIELFGTLFY